MLLRLSNSTGPTWRISHLAGQCRVVRRPEAGGAVAGRTAVEADGVLARERELAVHCPGQKPSFWAGKGPARPYKTAIESRFATESAKGA
jgi:hypothetical protein